MGSKDLAWDPKAVPQIPVLTLIFIHFFLQSIYQYYLLFYMIYVDSYFIFQNISPENTNNINTTQQMTYLINKASHVLSGML